jgi:predicted transcriptional regulator
VADVFAKILAIVATAGGPGGNITGLEPAVPYDQALERDSIFCLVCGKKMRSLKIHLRAVHSLTADQYRAMWNLPDNYPMVPEALAEKRSTISRKTQADFKAAHGMSIPQSRPPKARGKAEE